MRFTLSSTALGNQLSVLSKVLNSKNSLPILDCFLLEVAGNKLSITASDSENTMKTTLPIDASDGDGKFAVSSSRLMDAVKELPEQPLTVEVDTQALTVQMLYQNGVYNFMAQNADEYPVCQPLSQEATSLTLPSPTLAANISRSLFAVGTEELRPVMNGIYFDLTPEALAIVASDGHKLVRNRVYNVKTESPSSFVLPKKPATLLRTALLKDEGDTVIRFDNRTAEITFGDTTLQSRLIEGRYPNYNAVIPEDNPYIITMDRKALLSVLRRVLPFSSESSHLVRMHIETGLMVLSSQDLDFASSAKEDIVCDYVGTSMNIGFMGNSLTDILSSIASDDIKLELADPSRPCVILPGEQPENEEVLMLLMPMLLND